MSSTSTVDTRDTNVKTNQDSKDTKESGIRSDQDFNPFVFIASYLVAHCRPPGEESEEDLDE